VDNRSLLITCDSPSPTTERDLFTRFYAPCAETSAIEPFFSGLEGGDGGGDDDSSNAAAAMPAESAWRTRRFILFDQHLKDAFIKEVRDLGST